MKKREKNSNKGELFFASKTNDNDYNMETKETAAKGVFGWKKSLSIAICKMTGKAISIKDK